MGGALLGECMLRSGRRAGRIHLEVRAGNASAIRMYRREGFSFLGVREEDIRGTGEDAILSAPGTSEVGSAITRMQFVWREKSGSDEGRGEMFPPLEVGHPRPVEYKPGQFAMVSGWPESSPLLPRPLAI